MVMPLRDDDTDRQTVPIVTYALIAVNVLVWLIEMSAGESFINGLQHRSGRDNAGQGPGGYADHSGRRPECCHPAVPGPDADLPDAAHVDVHARVVGAHPRQHALSLDLW
jgi:hypothetical protein